jgi:hypothetical protein
MLGQRIGHYRIVRQIGAGGMGTVYEATHEQLGRRAAIKVLHGHLATDNQVTARFLNEGRAASMVDHPGIVQVFELGQLDGGAPYTVMELLRGESLRERMERAGGPLPVGLSLRIVRQTGDALVAAHAKGIVHRDLKPDNVMLVPDPAAEGGERTKLLDFGIAKVAEGLLHGGVRTQTGALLGTPLYMAPEQCLGAGRSSDRTDVYAVGVMLYQMLSGELPISGASLGDVLMGHMVGTPIPLRERNPAIPDGLAALVHRMMAKAPEERPSMQEVIAGIDPFLHGGAAPLPPPPAAPGFAHAATVYSGSAGQPTGASGPAPSKLGRAALVAGAVLSLVAGLVGTILLVGSEPAPPSEAKPSDAPGKTVPPEAAPVEEPTEAMPGQAGSLQAPPAIAAAIPGAPADEGAAKKKPRSDDPVPLSPRASEPAIPFRPKQTWRGDFLGGGGSGTRLCEDDRTQLTVYISRVKGRRVDAVFRFSSESSGHAGSYHMSGTYQPSGRRIGFRPGKWIKLDIHDNDRSEDFAAVGLDGRVDADGQLFSGQMTASPCKTFHLHPR